MKKRSWKVFPKFDPGCLCLGLYYFSEIGESWIEEATGQDFGIPEQDKENAVFRKDYFHICLFPFTVILLERTTLL